MSIAGALSGSWRSEPGALLSPRPAGLSHEEFQHWLFTTPGVPVPAARVKDLASSAARVPAGESFESFARH